MTRWNDPRPRSVLPALSEGGEATPAAPATARPSAPATRRLPVQPCFLSPVRPWRGWRSTFIEY